MSGLPASTLWSGPLGYAFALGLVGAANPCGLPLLPAYLSMFVDSGEARRWRPVRALGASVWVTGGFAVTFAVLGLALGAVVSSLESLVPWMMVPFGVALSAVGVVALAGRRIPLPQPPARLRGKGGPAMFGFGVVYALASLGCALPVFLAAVGANLGSRGAWTVLGASLAYALGMGLLLAVLALVAVSARGALVRTVRKAGRAGQVIGAALLVASGLYLAYDWAETLWNPGRSPALVVAVNRFQAELSSWISAHSAWLGAGFAAAVAAVLVAASLQGAKGPSRPSRPSRPPGRPARTGPSSPGLAHD